MSLTTATLCAKQVNESYLQFLTELNKKIAFVENLKKDSETTPGKAVPLAIVETEPHLQNLKNKATAKIREFLLQKIYQLSKPKTNIQILQETTFLRYKYFYRFLATYAVDVANEIHTNYVQTLSKIYASHFTGYIQALSKLSYSMGAGKMDLLGIPEAKTGFVSGLFGSGSKVANLKNIMNVFSLGNRKDDLDQLETSIQPHVAANLKQKIPYVIVSSFHTCIQSIQSYIAHLLFIKKVRANLQELQPAVARHHHE